VDDDDLRVHKTHGNAFEGTKLNSELATLGIQNLVVTGLVTNGCVRATCIGGHALGFHVVLVQDGHSTYVRDAGQVIAAWNRELSQEVAEIYPAAQIRLG
jgi:nicotinamidase-related amidase